MTRDTEKTELLKELGLGSHYEEALQLICLEGLSRSGKERISVSKIPLIEDLISAHFLICCTRGDCKNEARKRLGNRTLAVAADPADCEICSGSAMERYVQAAVQDCLRNNWSKVCIVGGSPETRLELRNTLGRHIQLRLVDGVASRNASDAQADCRWADAVIIWATTQLNHSVSNLYTQHPQCHTIGRRGVLKLCKGISKILNYPGSV